MFAKMERDVKRTEIEKLIGTLSRICNRRVEAVTMEAEDAYWRVVRGHIHYDGDERPGRHS